MKAERGPAKVVTAANVFAHIGELVSGFTTVTNSGGQLKLLGLNPGDLQAVQIEHTSVLPAARR